MKSLSEKIDLKGDGRIVLYKRAGLKNPKWQARVSVPNSSGYKIVSTKTTNLIEAQVVASNLYEELYFKVKAGGSVRSKRFVQVFGEWEESAAKSGKTRNDHSSARPPDPPLPHLGDRKRQLPLQSKLSRCGPKKKGSQ